MLCMTYADKISKIESLKSSIKIKQDWYGNLNPYIDLNTGNGYLRNFANGLFLREGELPSL